MKPISFRQFIKVSVATAIFCALLAGVTASLIAPHFAYMGYRPRDYSTWDLSVAVGCGSALVLLTPQRWRYPSHVAFSFLTATVALPIIVLPLCWGSLSTGELMHLYGTTLASFAIVRLLMAGDRGALRLYRVTQPVYWVCFGFTIVSTLAYLFYSTGISPRMLAFSDVYDQRLEYSQSVTSIGSYAVGWLGGGMLPASLAFGMYRRSRLMIVCSVSSICLLYSLTGYKSYLIGITLTVVAYFICKPQRRAGHHWVVSLSVVMLAASLLDMIAGGYLFTSLLVRRALLTAGLNTEYYFTYFADVEKYELRHSIFSFLGASPYHQSPAKVVGAAFYRDTTAANANFIADGFANFGTTGCLLAGVLVGLSLRGYDKVSIGLPLQVSAPALMLVLIAAANTAALTVLATHGGLIAALTVALLPRLDQHPREEAGSDHVSRLLGSRIDSRVPAGFLLKSH